MRRTTRRCRPRPRWNGLVHVNLATSHSSRSPRLAQLPVMGQGFDVLAALFPSVLRKQWKLASHLCNRSTRNHFRIEISTTAIVFLVARSNNKQTMVIRRFRCQGHRIVSCSTVQSTHRCYWPPRGPSAYLCLVMYSTATEIVYHFQ